MDESLLDTDILNEVLKRKSANVVRHAAEYLAQHGQFAVSSITRYEVLRGLLEKRALTQRRRLTRGPRGV
jgi:tRNA(fMet)-specific endonuclease VapC